MIHRANRIALAVLAGFLVFSGCSSSRVGMVRGGHRTPLLVPAGVDSTVAARADSMAQSLFVSLPREERSDRLKSLGKSRTSASDTLWQVLAQAPDPDGKVSEENAAGSVAAFNRGATALQKVAGVSSGAGGERAKLRVQVLLREARESFERALMLNPFDLETRSWLARVYQTLAARFLDANDGKKAIGVLEKLVRLEKGEHSLFARLAEAYYAGGSWRQAHRNFQQAESVLRSAAGLDFQEFSTGQASAEIDSAALFYYAYYQGDTEIKMHDSASGLASLRRALRYARTGKERADIRSYLDWIDWDSGNVAAVEKRDKYLELESRGEYRNAARGFLTLIPLLRTRKAADEIEWRLAVLEFQHLRRQNQGIERLNHVVQRAARNSSGAPVDSSYQRYFDSYGVMCHNLGLENIRKNRRFAFTYFQQAAAVAWRNRAKSYLEIAKMSRNNPRSVIQSCKSALEHAEQLDANEQMQAFQLLVEAMKRSGQFNEARRYYGKWIEMRNARRRASR